MTNETFWLSAPSSQVASSPVWHPEEKSLYWSDIVACKLYKYDPSTGVTETVLDDGRPTGAIVLQANGSLLLLRDGANIVTFKNGEITGTVINAISDYKQTRFSAACADSSGRVVCAVISDVRHPARLLLLDRSGKLSLIEDDFGIPAGLAFSPDGSSLYFDDSHGTHLSTWRYPYEAEAENPFTHARTLFHACFDDGNTYPGAPAGIAAMEDGSLWIARRDGAMFVHHNEDGKILNSFRIPIRKPTGLCFAGDDLTDAYVTTSSAHRKTLEGIHAGDLALVRGLGKGAKPFVSKIILDDCP